MKAAWAEAKAGKRKEVFIHGWVSYSKWKGKLADDQVYDLATGLLKDLGVTQGPNGPVESDSPKVNGA